MCKSEMLFTNIIILLFIFTQAAASEWQSIERQIDSYHVFRFSWRIWRPDRLGSSKISCSGNGEYEIIVNGNYQSCQKISSSLLNVIQHRFYRLTFLENKQDCSLPGALADVTNGYFITQKDIVLIYGPVRMIYDTDMTIIFPIHQKEYIWRSNINGYLLFLNRKPFVEIIIRSIHHNEPSFCIIKHDSRIYYSIIPIDSQLDSFGSEKSIYTLFSVKTFPPRIQLHRFPHDEINIHVTPSILKCKSIISFLKCTHSFLVLDQLKKNKWINYDQDSVSTAPKIMTNIESPFACIHSIESHNVPIMLKQDSSAPIVLPPIPLLDLSIINPKCIDDMNCNIHNNNLNTFPTSICNENANPYSHKSWAVDSFYKPPW